MASMNSSPPSPPCLATFPHELVCAGYPPVPNPILESLVMQSYSLLPIMPIRALDEWVLPLNTLKPSLWQFGWREAWEPINFFHSSRPRLVGRYSPSWIREYSEILLVTLSSMAWKATETAKNLSVKRRRKKKTRLKEVQQKSVLVTLAAFQEYCYMISLCVFNFDIKHWMSWNTHSRNSF